MNTPTEFYWRGNDINSLPREKLIEIIGHLARQLNDQRDSLRSVINIQRIAIARRQ